MRVRHATLLLAEPANCRPVLALKFKHNNHPLDLDNKATLEALSKSKTTVVFLGLLAHRRSGGSSAPATTVPRGTAARWSGEMLDLTPNDLGDFIDRLFELKVGPSSVYTVFLVRGGL